MATVIATRKPDNSPEALADRRQNCGIRAEISELLIRRTVKLGYNPNRSIRIWHNCFSQEEQTKAIKAAYNNRADIVTLQEFIFRIKTTVESRITKEVRSYMWEKLVDNAVDCEKYKAASIQRETLKLKAELAAKTLLQSLPETQFEGYSKEELFHVLKYVMNDGFIYSKQRADGGVTIYGKDNTSPTNVSSIGAAKNSAIMGLAGRLAKVNAYVGQQWEKLN